jgi:hypothetical protein
LPQQYTWNGTILPLQEIDITLTSLNSLSAMSFAALSGTYIFEAKILTVNGVADEDNTNNTFKSSFVVAPTWPTQIIVSMKTNNQNENGSTAVGNSETSWEITDLYGNVYASRNDAQTSTQYNDTVNFAVTGTYKLTITDGSCDGLHWWYYAAAQIAITNGSLFVKKKTGTTVSNIPMNGYSYTGNYNHDFGCTFTQYFTTIGNLATGVSETNLIPANITVYPNPAVNSLQITVDGFENYAGKIQIFDALGQIVFCESTNSNDFEINTSEIKAGIYNVVYTSANNKSLVKKLAILK